ncbi:MAG: mitochondrial fission ELM1 family protein [Pseudomonadales bacterium]|nr:mitochondrial fission ELM1 family protein [Pseudomonadales bacterium]
MTDLPYPMPNTPLIIWRFIDGKPGHEKQSQGLIQGLQDITAVSVETIALQGSFFQRLQQSQSICSTLSKRSTPKLLIGAGHATHVALLRAKKKYGGLSVILMKPSLPCRWFDFVLIPKHDSPKERPFIIPTEGALAPVKVGNKQKNKGLILIGGPDKRNIWDNDTVWRQIESICNAQKDIDWQLSTSRRTPEDFIAKENKNSNLKTLDWRDTPPNWLVNQLAEARYCWVSQDSVSMLYEALSAQCAVAALELEKEKSDDKISRNLERLVAEKYLTTFSGWDQNKTLPPGKFKLEEHLRCAKIILERINGV